VRHATRNPTREGESAAPKKRSPGQHPHVSLAGVSNGARRRRSVFKNGTRVILAVEVYRLQCRKVRKLECGLLFNHSRDTVVTTRPVNCLPSRSSLRNFDRGGDQCAPAVLGCFSLSTGCAFPRTEKEELRTWSARSLFLAALNALRSSWRESCQKREKIRLRVWFT